MRESRDIRDMRARVRAGQRGATLIEVLVVCGVLVPVVLAASVGLLLTVKLSSTTKITQELEAAVASYAESLKQLDYVPCGDADTYRADAELWQPPAGAGITIDLSAEPEYWDQASAGYVAGPCATDEGAQLIAITATKQDETVVSSVVKRDPAASAAALAEAAP